MAAAPPPSPLRDATGAAASGALAVLPLLCGLACWAWARLSLPHADRPAGRRISNWLQRAALASLALAGASALGGGPGAWALWALEALGLAAAWALGAPGGRPLRRYVRSGWLLVLPLLHRRLMGWWVRHAGLSEAEARVAYEALHAAHARRLVDELVALGGLFVKAGQAFSLFSNIGLPPAYLRELKRLQSEVPPLPGAEARRLVAEALGGPLEEAFSHFEDAPVGSASLGQVHRARLAAGGREVAVKLRFPAVTESLEMDFAWIEWLVRRLAPEQAAAVRELRAAFLRELDFLAEARALARARAGLCGAFPEVAVPEPLPGLCRPGLLVMSFVPGISVLDSLLRAAGLAARLSGRSVEDLFAAAARASTEIKPGEEVENAYAGPRAGPGAGLLARLAAVRLYQAARNAGADLCNPLLRRLGAAPLAYCQLLPSFDPVRVSRTAWRVQGHQLLVDGFFNTDAHPGNFLVDPRTGNIGLIDFGQVCEIGLETRVRFARLVVALAAGDETEIALQHARLGMRTRRMSTEQLVLHARMKYGRITSREAMEIQARLRVLDAADPVLATAGDEKLALVEKMIMLLRGTNVFLGVLGKHSAQTMWLEPARRLLAEHGAAFPEEPVALDLAPPAPGTAWSGGEGARAPALGAAPGAEPPERPAAGSEPLSGASLGLALLGAQWLGMPAP